MNSGGGSTCSRPTIRKGRLRYWTPSYRKPAGVPNRRALAVLPLPDFELTPNHSPRIADAPRVPTASQRRTIMMRFAGLLTGLMTAVTLVSPSFVAHAQNEPKPLPPIPLTLEEVFSWVDRSHPLLKGAGTEKIVARGKLLRALGAFEPALVNDTEMERFIPSTGPQDSRTVGFNDTILEARHPS